MDQGSDSEQDRAWGVARDRAVPLADSGREEQPRVQQVQLAAAGGALALDKAYLLPKDHALHIPPHVALSRLEDQVEGLAATLRELQHRNYEKDKGKQFEGSYTRVGFIMIITYFTLCAYMIAIDVSAPFLNAIVPTVGFNLSTWSLPWVKQIWMGVYDFNWGKPKEFQPLDHHPHSHTHTSTVALPQRLPVPAADRGPPPPSQGAVELGSSSVV